MAAFVGLGVFRNYDEAVRHMVQKQEEFMPDMEQHAVYEELYSKIFRNIYGRLAPLYEKLNEIYRKIK